MDIQAERIRSSCALPGLERVPEIYPVIAEASFKAGQGYPDSLESLLKEGESGRHRQEPTGNCFYEKPKRTFAAISETELPSLVLRLWHSVLIDRYAATAMGCSRLRVSSKPCKTGLPMYFRHEPNGLYSTCLNSYL